MSKDVKACWWFWWCTYKLNTEPACPFASVQACVLRIHTLFSCLLPQKQSHNPIWFYEILSRTSSVISQFISLCRTHRGGYRGRRTQRPPPFQSQTSSVCFFEIMSTSVGQTPMFLVPLESSLKMYERTVFVSCWYLQHCASYPRLNSGNLYTMNANFVWVLPFSLYWMLIHTWPISFNWSIDSPS